MKDFAAEAERKRTLGDAHAAIEIAEEGLSLEPGNDRIRMALALALMDVGDVPRAQQLLAKAFPRAEEPPAPTPPPVPTAAPESAADFDDSLGEDELEQAFADAETNPEEMMSANRVVEQTLEAEHVEAPEAGFDITGSSTYATATMASLLEEQGRAGQATALREALEIHGENGFTEDAVASAEMLDAAEAMPDAAGPMPPVGDEWANAEVGPDLANRLRVVATLESWLHNLRTVRGQRETDTRGNA